MKKKDISTVKQTSFLFSISYILFVFSLFNRDTSDVEVLFPITIPAKYVSLVVLIAGILLKTYSRDQIRGGLILLCADLLILVRSGSSIFILISLFAFCANKLEDKEIIKMAFCTLLIFIGSVLLFSVVGIYSDEITRRWVGSAARHSLGFYHSNVLPLVYCYLVGYGLAIGAFKKKCYFVLIAIDLTIYCLCGSRNSLLMTLLLILGKWLIDSAIIKSRAKKNINKIFGFCARIMVPLLTVISLCIPLLLDVFPLFKTLDFMFSYRFSCIASMIQKLGIGFMPQISNESYFGSGIVIDNGYAFLTIRYGIVMPIFLSILVYCVAKKYQNNTFVLFLAIIVSCCNFIDNDLIDYCVLPYLIICEKYLIKWLKKEVQIWKNLSVW